MARPGIGYMIVLLAAGPALAGDNYPQTVPAEELRLDAALPGDPAHDAWGTALGNASGDVCALTLENFRVRSRVSVDGGVSFAGEIDVDGGFPGVRWTAFSRRAPEAAAEETGR